VALKSDKPISGAPIAIIMGSQSDWATMKHAADTLDQLGIAHDDRIVSAHRTPDRLVTPKAPRLMAFASSSRVQAARRTCPA
jgi:phosphoribosylcarboxyaminoimidazole (NCAIR) mutase